jgi:hypothetical protein
MKTKFEKTLTAATAATIATVLSLTAPAKASEIDDLIEALAPYMPTQDRMQIQTDNDLLKEFDLDGPFTIGADVEDFQIAYLGEAAGYVNNLTYSSSNGSGTIFSPIRSKKELIDPVTNQGVGTFSVLPNLDGETFLQVGTTDSLGSFSMGDTLDFTLTNKHNGDGVSLSQNTGNFKAYTFQDWVILGIEDDKSEWSDWDYNDTVVAFKLGDVADVPEPSTTLALLGVGAAGLVLRRKSLTK